MSDLIVQGTDEWRLERCGKITASRINDALNFTKKGESAKRRDYRIQLVMERLTGQPMDNHVDTWAMQWGRDHEPFARIAYCEARQVRVDQVSFVSHPTLAMCGASPDGLVGKDGLIEIKCPQSFTHMGYILEDVVPEDYRNQMLFQMVCTGRYWCDFVSFDPRFPKHLQLFVKRFKLDTVPEEEIQTMLEGIRTLNNEVFDLTTRLMTVA